LHDKVQSCLARLIRNNELKPLTDPVGSVLLFTCTYLWSSRDYKSFHRINQFAAKETQRK